MIYVKVDTFIKQMKNIHNIIEVHLFVLNAETQGELQRIIASIAFNV